MRRPNAVHIHRREANASSHVNILVNCWLGACRCLDERRCVLYGIYDKETMVAASALGGGLHSVANVKLKVHGIDE